MLFYCLMSFYYLTTSYLQLGQDSLPDKLVLRLSSIQAMGLMETLWVQ